VAVKGVAVRMSLIGNFEHKLDAKGRLVIPSCFREELGTRVVATSISNECISLYSERNWEDVVTRLEEISKQSPKGDTAQRRILANSFRLEVDSMGRVLISEKLRKAAGIEQDVCINGNNKKLEIWDSALWRKFMGDSEELVPDINALVPGL
jgi:MraZ protein